MNKFGLDFRSIRYPAMIGPNVRTPGHWAPHMIEDSIAGRPNECIYTIPERGMPMIYLTDAARAADMVLQAPKEKIKMVNYCVASVPDSVSAKELETILTKRYPKTKVNYNMDPAMRALMGKIGITTRFDDSYARKEWGWNPLYTTAEAIVDKIGRAHV